MDKQQSLAEIFKNNKLLAFGLPIILLILLIDAFVLRPSRKAANLERQGVRRSISTPVATTATKATNASSRPPIQPANQMVAPVYPDLSDKIVDRFRANTRYAFPEARNIFVEPEVKEEPEPILAVEEVFVRPNLNYHGFFVVGKDKVAIFHDSEQVLLAKAGDNVRHTTFKVKSITAEKVNMVDVSGKLKDFEIWLVDSESN